MERGRQRRVDVLVPLLERLPADDLAAVTRALVAEQDEAAGSGVGRAVSPSAGRSGGWGVLSPAEDDDGPCG
jgi:hypothetical protein